MGQCVSCVTQPRSSSAYNFERSQSVSRESALKSTLCFHAVLGNIILKKYPYETAIPVFKINPYQALSFPQQEVIGDIPVKWKNQEKVDFKITEEQLKNTCLEVQVLKTANQIVGRIKINLFLIANGPYHQDFAIEYKNGKKGRISFDLKLSQIIQLKIRSCSAEILLLKDHPGQEFRYSIKTIVGYNGEISESKESYPQIVKLQKKSLEVSSSPQEEVKETQNNKDEDVTKKIKEVQTGKDLLWHQSKGSLPILTTKVIASQLHNTYFQVLIWKQREFFADTYVSFYKLFATDAMRFSVGQLDYESRSIQITQKIEHYGKDYGKGTFCFKIENQPYYRQYQICVHTQVGILKTTPLFTFQSSKKSEKICSQLKELEEICEKIEQNIMLVSNLESSITNQTHIRQVKQQIQLNLQKMFNLLQKTSYPPSFLYHYNSEDELIRGQKILLSIGMKTSEYFTIEDPVINDICWLILISLIKRYEFSLSHMGFQEKEKEMLINNSTNSYLKQKLKLAGIYKMFNYKLLNLALGSLNRKGSEYQTTFAQIYCACAYFKIPQFRKEILQLITKQDDPQINQWRGIQFNLHEDIQEKRVRGNANIFSQLFDWQQQVYRWIVKQDDLERDSINLGDILSQSEWKEKFIKRGTQFFYFFKYWVTYIESSLPRKKEIQWRYFPGYNRLLKAFFAQMKKIPILQYPDALIQSSLKIIDNEKLLNPLIQIMISKVNVYNSSQVFRAIEYLNLIFNFFTSKKRILSISFNYSYFFKSLKIILESESSLGINSVLNLIYSHFNLFHIEFKRSISMYLLGKIFWKLFLHWSYPVRTSFYHLITYKIYGEAYFNRKQKLIYKFMVEDTDIIQRYKEIGKIIETKNKDLKFSIKQLDVNAKDKDYYKKLKAKISKRMHHNESQQSGSITKAQVSTKQILDERFIESGKITAVKSIKINYSKYSTIQQRQYHSQFYLQPSNPNINLSDVRTKSKDYSTSKLLDQHFKLFQKIIHEQQFQMCQLKPELTKLITAYLPEFKKVQKAFMKSLDKEQRCFPQLRAQIAIDNREIRPQQIDNW